MGWDISQTTTTTRAREGCFPAKTGKVGISTMVWCIDVSVVVLCCIILVTKCALKVTIILTSVKTRFSVKGAITNVLTTLH